VDESTSLLVEGVEPVAAGLIGTPVLAAEEVAVPAVEALRAKTSVGNRGDDRMLRINAQRMSHILGVSGEILVESRRLATFSDSLMLLKRRQNELMEDLEGLLYRQGHGAPVGDGCGAAWVTEKTECLPSIVGPPVGIPG